MKPLPHQMRKSKEVFEKLKKHKYCYLAGEVRSGKTYTAILALENSKTINNILVLTKKNAISGWKKFIPYSTKNYTITNYEQVGSYKLRYTNKNGKELKKPKKELIFKLNPSNYDFIIIDEAHTLGKVGKPSQRYKILKEFVNDKPFLALSGTPIVETPLSIYHQMSISTYTPFPEKNFYEFFKKWGIPQYLKLYGRLVNQYTKAKPELLDYISKFTVYMTQKDAGIDIENNHKIHYIKLKPDTMKIYNTLLSDNVVETKYGTIIADSTMKLRTTLHQIEGGTVKIDNTIHIISTEKINYIKDNFPNNDTVGIMCHFKAERDLIKKYLPDVQIYSSNAHAEGVDLSHLKHFIIYSNDYSGAKFIQRCDRITNVNGSNTNTIHHLLVKNGISEQVYYTVKEKQDFNNKVFKRKELK